LAIKHLRQRIETLDDTETVGGAAIFGFIGVTDTTQYFLGVVIGEPQQHLDAVFEFEIDIAQETETALADVLDVIGFVGLGMLDITVDDKNLDTISLGG
jgi:hypothetical protein